jgi:hypothetical protein
MGADASSATIAATVALEMELVRPTEMGPATISRRDNDDKAGLRDHPGVGSVNGKIRALRELVAEQAKKLGEYAELTQTGKIARYEREIQRLNERCDRLDRELSDRSLKSRGQ